MVDQEGAMTAGRRHGGRVAVLGIFVMDIAYRAFRHPRPGETVMGTSYALGPGGKGSNQAVAAARAGAAVDFVTRIGRDDFAETGRRLWAEAGIAAHVTESDLPTGSAGIVVEESSGNNAIVVCPGAAGELSIADVDAAEETLGEATVFVTQLEQPAAVAAHALALARRQGAVTVLNPAPAAPLPPGMLADCDWVVPNESEAEGLTGMPVQSLDEAAAAGHALIAQGARGAVLTLGGRGALVVTPEATTPIPAIAPGPVVDTTGAGDVFTGAFCAALAEGAPAVTAARFAAAAAGIAVTRPGAAASAPSRAEIEALLRRG
jgi:ribokinase